MNTTIKVEHLKKSYGNTCVVNDISLSVNEGEVFGLLGANGAGKSTTIECILGTRQADSGTVEILGMCPTKERKRLFENVGVQFQESNYQEKILVSELCEETQCLYKEVTDYKILLKQFGLSDKLKSPVSELSGGQKQKLFIATVYKGNIIKNLIMDCQSYTKYRPNETTGGIFVSWRRKEELPTGA